MTAPNTKKSFSSIILEKEKRSEVKLLLYCVRSYIDTMTAEKIENLSNENIDWELFLRLASHNGTIALCYHALNDTCPNAVPPAIFEQLRHRYQQYTLNNIFFTKELLKLLKLFEENNIPAFPYKGPVLASSVYRDLSLRYFCDLDILIRPEDFIQVKNLLIAKGYETVAVKDIQEADNLRSDSVREFIRKDGKVVIDLHWYITPKFFPFLVSFESLWKRRQQESILGQSVWTLSPEDLLLILCVHGSKECWHKLKWIVDIAQTISAYPNLNWKQVLTQANLFHSKRMLFMGLFLANSLLRAKIPLSVLSQAQQEPIIYFLSREVYQQLFEQSTKKLFLFTFWKPSWFRLQVRERLQDKFQYLSRRIITPNFRDRRVIILPKTFSFLYYLIRLLRLVGEKIRVISRE